MKILIGIPNMKKTTTFFVLVITVLLNSCSVFSSISYSTPEILFTNEFSGDSIAVFDFATQGSYLPASAGKYAADKLTELLFLKGKFKIIDRSLVRKIQASLSITKTEIIDKDQLKKFASETGAKYVILGRLFQATGSDFLDPDTKKSLTFSFRILSPATGEVVGISSMEACYKGKYEVIIDNIINEIVEEMRQVK